MVLIIQHPSADEKLDKKCALSAYGGVTTNSILLEIPSANEVHNLAA